MKGITYPLSLLWGILSALGCLLFVYHDYHVRLNSWASHHIISYHVASHLITSHHHVTWPHITPHHIRSHHITTSHCHMTWHDMTWHDITPYHHNQSHHHNPQWKPFSQEVICFTFVNSSTPHHITPHHIATWHDMTWHDILSPQSITSPQSPVETVLTRSNLLHIRELLDTPSAQISPKPALLASPPRSLGRHISYMGEQIYV